MPTAPPARCTDPDCGALAVNRGRCAEHQRKAWANRSRNTDALTGAERARFRAAVLARDPVCRVCGVAPATEADHIIPVAQGGALLDFTTGQGLCAADHLAKTIAEREAARRAR